ncbi:MAG: toprim domain-containing protein [[Clostridium] innocuum]
MQQRGYTKELIDQQQLGHIPEKEKLLNFLEKKGYSRQELIEADVFSLTAAVNGKVVSYPIITAHGEVRGFTARTIGKGHDQPKYVNTSESTIFAKRKLLYGGPKAIEAARQKHELIIVEGSADVDMLTQAGYLNCVATLGTALTEDHVQALKRMNVRIRLCYDGDAAGIKATMAAASLLRKNGILPFCASLPLGK